MKWPTGKHFKYFKHEKQLETCKYEDNDLSKYKASDLKKTPFLRFRFNGGSL